MPTAKGREYKTALALASSDMSTMHFSMSTAVQAPNVAFIKFTRNAGVGFDNQSVGNGIMVAMYPSITKSG